MMEWLVTGVYSLSLLYVFLFSLGQLHLAWVYARYRKKGRPAAAFDNGFVPYVTVQLPVFNE
ncbi:MAG TPA: histidine kinase, partial [Cyclobacteriaceae bacterium]|nr:histidine kinase [Cyclobacteriaceae bacterium]